MEEFRSGMPPSYSQLELESTASHIAAAGRLKDGDEAGSKPEFRLPFLTRREFSGAPSEKSVCVNFAAK
jgi:hypothetical protein